MKNNKIAKLKKISLIIFFVICGALLLKPMSENANWLIYAYISFNTLIFMYFLHFITFVVVFASVIQNMKEKIVKIGGITLIGTIITLILLAAIINTTTILDNFMGGLLFFPTCIIYIITYIILLVSIINKRDLLIGFFQWLFGNIFFIGITTLLILNIVTEVEGGGAGGLFLLLVLYGASAIVLAASFLISITKIFSLKQNKN